MNDQLHLSEERLQEIAASFRYPPAPDLVAARRRTPPRATTAPRPIRYAWVALALLLLLLGLLAVPSVRAAVFEFFQIGAIRILPVAATATPVESGAGAAQPGATVSPAETGAATRTLLDLAGATTWEEAQARAAAPLRLPTYPPGLGLPDEVYVQTLWDPGMDEPVFIFVWHDPERPGAPALALYQIAAPYYGMKFAAPEAVGETEVNGLPAYWIPGPHRIRLESGAVEELLIVEGNVLVWADDVMTYRLEGAATMAEAARIAASLQTVETAPAEN